jgi:hypothetical protein
MQPRTVLQVKLAEKNSRMLSTGLFLLAAIRFPASAYSGDADHDSGMMPISIPG